MYLAYYLWSKVWYSSNNSSFHTHICLFHTNVSLPPPTLRKISRLPWLICSSPSQTSAQTSPDDFSGPGDFGCIGRSHLEQTRLSLKVSVLAWRLLRDRLPTKANLANWGIIPQAAWLCVSVAVASRRRNTYSFHVALSVLFGRQFDIELIFWRWILILHRITLLSLLVQQAVLERGDPFCSLCNSFAFRWCGMQELSLLVVKH
jgi:hypothetical protein